MENPNQNHEAKQLSPQWTWLINSIREEKLTFGEARVIFHNGEPVEIVELLRKKRYNPIV